MHLSHTRIAKAFSAATIAVAATLAMSGCSTADATDSAPTEASVETQAPAPEPKPVTMPEGYDQNNGPHAGSSNVLLTFDDGPETTQQWKSMLEIPAKTGTTFVVAPTGEAIEQYHNETGGNLAKEARQAGIYVISHTVTHPHFSQPMTKNKIVDELSFPAVTDTNYVRPPYGELDDKGLVVDTMMEHGKLPWLWTYDTNDWQADATKESVIDGILSDVKSGDTVLAHMQHSIFNPEAYTEIMNGLDAKGLKLCPSTGQSTPAQIPDKIC